jgi:hypothetical protein
VIRCRLAAPHREHLEHQLPSLVIE